jgi:hypothetical protein
VIKPSNHFSITVSIMFTEMRGINTGRRK